jgi:hypothetical protein
MANFDDIRFTTGGIERLVIKANGCPGLGEPDKEEPVFTPSVIAPWLPLYCKKPLNNMVFKLKYRYPSTITEPNTGRKLHPVSMVPIETHVDFTDIKIWE